MVHCICISCSCPAGLSLVSLQGEVLHLVLTLLGCLVQRNCLLVNSLFAQVLWAEGTTVTHCELQCGRCTRNFSKTICDTSYQCLTHWNISTTMAACLEFPLFFSHHHILTLGPHQCRYMYIHVVYVPMLLRPFWCWVRQEWWLTWWWAEKTKCGCILLHNNCSWVLGDYGTMSLHFLFLSCGSIFKFSMR